MKIDELTINEWETSNATDDGKINGSHLVMQLVFHLYQVDA